MVVRVFFLSLDNRKVLRICKKAKSFRGFRTFKLVDQSKMSARYLKGQR